MQLGSCIAVAVVQAGSYNSDSSPSLGTSYTTGSALKTKRRKRNVLSKVLWYQYKEGMEGETRLLELSS